ncbi:MAG TPA: T9SS type A sorting domain-containing protein [Bacteroidia bacterium]|jgi:photosystem II stability/assembly factor-like uncharacterized protein|nr:T9SS type A sorting domain-containing protein [Bacteroidia bacterium]
MKKIFFLLIILPFIFHAQTFVKNTTGRALTFKEIQLQFETYKKKTDLTKVKHWKYFKRWEHDMLLHTNTQGEPAGFADYISAAIDMANFKQEQQNSSLASTWVPTGPNVLPNNLTGYMENGIGRINCVAFHPTIANTYFAGVAQGGVWKTTNNGTSWTPLTDNLPITRVSDICIDPANPNTMYISVCDFEYIGVSLFLNGRKRNTHYGLGVYKTTDGGLTWAATGLTFQLTNGDASLIRKVLVNPTNSNELCAAGVSGMYKSMNGGTTWNKVMDSLFWDLHQDPMTPNILYASTGWVATSNLGNAGVYKSTDFGNTWAMLNTSMPLTGTIQRVKLAIAPNDNNYIYAACADINQGLYGIYKSTNAGLTWTYIAPVDNVLEAGTGSGSGGQGNYDLAFLVNPTNKNTVYIGGVNMWASTDGAATFNPVSHWTTSYGPTIHGDFHYLAYQSAGNQFFACSDGGMYRTSTIIPSTWSTTSWPTTWTKLNSGMQVTSFYRISSSRNAMGRLVAGAQDNGNFYYKGGTWSTIFGGDGMDGYLDPINNTNVIAASQYGSFNLSTNDGVSSISPNTNPAGENSEWTTPIVADYNNPGRLFIGNENVVRSTDNGNTWNSLTTMPGATSSEISALAVANSNSLVLYAARRVRYEFGVPGAMFKTTNGGTSWTNVTLGLPDSLYYTSVEINQTNPNEVYVTMAGFSSGRKVYKTTNAGVSWTNISYNLPNIPVNCIKQIPGTSNFIVATDIGIYTLSGSSTTWVNNSFGLPNVILTDIEFNSALNKAYVSTFGRGIWETPLNVLTGLSGAIADNTLSFNLFPSVNNGEFEINLNVNGEKSVEIIDVMGKIVYSQKFSTEKIPLNLNLASGAYYAKIVSGDKVGVKKFIIQ